MKNINLLYILLLQAALVMFALPSFAATASNVKCDKCVGTSDIAKKAVNSSRIKPGAVTTSKIKDGAVTAAKLSGDISIMLTTTTRSNFSSANIGGTFYSEVISTSCLNGEVLTGGGCDCEGNFTADFSSTNFGELDACVPSGNSMIGRCSVSIGSVDEALFGPPVTVFAICAPAAPSPLSVSANVQTLSIKTESNLPPDNESGTPDLAAQIMIDRVKSTTDYREEQMMLKISQ